MTMKAKNPGTSSARKARTVSPTRNSKTSPTGLASLPSTPIMGRCDHGKSMFENCGQCLWQEIGGEYHDDKPPWYVEEFDLTISSGGDYEEPE